MAPSYAKLLKRADIDAEITIQISAQAWRDIANATERI